MRCMCLCDKLEVSAEIDPSKEKICKDGESTDYGKNKDLRSFSELVLKQFR